MKDPVDLFLAPFKVVVPSVFELFLALGFRGFAFPADTLRRIRRQRFSCRGTVGYLLSDAVETEQISIQISRPSEAGKAIMREFARRRPEVPTDFCILKAVRVRRA